MGWLEGSFGPLTMSVIFVTEIVSSCVPLFLSHYLDFVASGLKKKE